MQKKSFESVSRIHKGKHKILKDLDDFCSLKSGNLTGELNNMSTQCKTIRQALHYVELINVEWLEC